MKKKMMMPLTFHCYSSGLACGKLLKNQNNVQIKRFYRGLLDGDLKYLYLT